MSAPFERLASEFARSVHRTQSESERLRRGVELVVDLVDGCDHAGVTMASRHSVWSAAATDDVVLQGDALQYAFGEGPCLDTVHEHHVVISQDLAGELRWPRWAPRAVADLGVNGMASLPLCTPTHTLGALNLYADRVRTWRDESILVGSALAAHLAVAVVDAREIEHRGQAMAGRTVIGQAQGILMERFGLDADRAFDYLRRISQDSNRKLVLVAAEIVETRRLPEAGSQTVSPDATRRT